MKLFDPQRLERNGLRYMAYGGMVPMIHVRPIDETTVKVMIFLQTKSASSYKDFSTEMPIWRLKMWLEEWVADPEYVCKRDFAYIGPSLEVAKPPEAKKVSLEELGLA